MAEGSSPVLMALMLTLVGGASTALGGLLVVLQPAPDMKRLGLLQGLAAGLMLTLSFSDLMHNAINEIGFAKANLWFFGGVLFFAGVVFFIPEPTLAPAAANTKKIKATKGDVTSGAEKEKEKILMKKKRRQVLFSGVVTAIGIGLHNFPEGIAVFLGSLKGLRVGISLALAIALHNIPEGVAVALPVYFATQSKWKAFLLSALSGVAEPLGVVIVAIFFPSSLSPEVLEGLLAAVGGIMAFLTLHEMLPLALDYAGHRKAISAVFVGMALMAVSLQLLEMSLPHDIG